ncbi:MAG: hypothetical protein WBA16_08075 [Nonlabens sp.]
MISYSNEESEILGYRVARSNEYALLNINETVHYLTKEKIDVLKLTIDNPDPTLYIKLDQLGFPYYVLGITQSYKSSFTRNPKHISYLHEDLSFKSVNDNLEPIIESLVSDIFRTNTSSFFTNPLLQLKHNEYKEMQVLLKYIAKYDERKDPEKFTHIMHYREQPVGFISSYKEGIGGGVAFAGILDKFVGRGFYIDLVRFIQNFGKSIEQKWGIAHAQLHHTVIHKSFVREGMVPHGSTMNVHINCAKGNLYGLQIKSSYK